MLVCISESVMLMLFTGVRGLNGASSMCWVGSTAAGVGFRLAKALIEVCIAMPSAIFCTTVISFPSSLRLQEVYTDAATVAVTIKVMSVPVTHAKLETCCGAYTPFSC